LLFAQICDEAGVPPGVFNLVNGDGPTVGEALSAHPGIDMMSFTGSTRAGIAVAKAAADTVKRVAQELGGKSANIVLDDADLQKAVAQGVLSVMNNSGQSCNAPTRMFVPRAKQDQAMEIAKAAAAKVKVGDPFAEGTTMGPVVSEVQFNKIQALIQKGIDEGATLVTGGVGRPEGLNRGYYVRPTVFANVTNDMTIAREEIFGPVLSVIHVTDLDEAIALVNSSAFGNTTSIFTSDGKSAREYAARIEVGMVGVNVGVAAPMAFFPFSGWKNSFYGDLHAHGRDAVAFYTEQKVIMSRWF
jgi:aldehyde dehydrogenase (NAD+)